MKTLILILGMWITFSPAYCPEMPEELKFNFVTTYFVDKMYDAIFEATAYVESRNNPNAVNRIEQAYGIVQIRQIRLDDYFQRTGTRYYLTQMQDPIKAKEVFMYYAKQYPPEKLEQICREWNGGPKGMKYVGTKKYYEKVNNQIKKLQV